MDESAIWQIVRHYAAQVGHENFAPHDARRSCARIYYDAKAPLKQIKFLLGHDKLDTTARYVNDEQKFGVTKCLNGEGSTYSNPFSSLRSRKDRITSSRTGDGSAWRSCLKRSIPSSQNEAGNSLVEINPCGKVCRISADIRK